MKGFPLRVSSLLACSLIAFVARMKGATEELPSLEVTGKITPPGDVVSRDLDQRSPDIHWPKGWDFKTSEMFAHNVIDIHAPCTIVWNFLVQAESWPHWCAVSGKVKVKGRSQVLEKNTKFTWNGYDLPHDNSALFDYPATSLDAQVTEFVPDSRIAWCSYGPFTWHGYICITYHNWLLTPLGPDRCRVTFEEQATGRAARYARGAYPEILHVSHAHWLVQLKKASEHPEKVSN